MLVYNFVNTISSFHLSLSFLFLFVLFSCASLASAFKSLEKDQIYPLQVVASLHHGSMLVPSIKLKITE